MSYDRNRQRRPLYTPPPPPSRHRQHGLLTYWVPLVTIGTLAVGGLAAWIWTERNEHHDEDYPPSQKPQRPPQRPPPGPGGPPPPGGEAASYYGSSRSQEQHVEERHEDGQTFLGQVRGAMRRTPSPQQIFDHASKQVSASIAAAGSALGSIMEDPENGHAYTDERVERRERKEDREGFSDHERWSEEADEKRRVGLGKARRTVAVVVSADTNMDGKMDEEDVVYSEHASILSHLPPHHDPSTTDLFILIYAPGLPSPPPLNYRPSTMDVDTASNIGSSYSQMNTPAQTPGSELQSISPRFDALYQQALSLVDDPSKVLCFTTTDGYVHILRHLVPWMVYVSDLLAGHNGQVITQLADYVGHMVLVLGDDGTGGLADTETEDEAAAGRDNGRWYDRSSIVGRGKPLEVVDAARMGEDWAKRVGGKD
ncbi:hypothetical protein BAUCODRAFT_117472 [Baudoinia panamericana UAMH 10762]|uniref:Uncharacterized protein n=1 Tax=Baudoinia panamericana (strain UAMH 10762) TaxID=717646 RepID=M2MIT6_BAUPA|nr:uncharacterized protein BAUCODRAFT_117472 [Baudoinia panamericana UAMH 10762]EMC91183.1 hypothetical protein BAUCODRAFT_117472 [Baudoinia panamericana UAMH 10762]